MTRARKTGFDRYFEGRMEDPEFALSYKEARARIDAIDHLIRKLDSARQAQGLSKAELARRVGVRPESIRRLFSASSPNPTVDTVIGVARALDLQVTIETKRPRSRARRRRTAA